LSHPEILENEAKFFEREKKSLLNLT